MSEFDDVRYIDITGPDGRTITFTLDHARINGDTLEATCKYRVVAKSEWDPCDM